MHKIYDGAKTLQEKAYRKTFYKHTPQDWHVTVVDGRSFSEYDQLSYKLP
jgi:hypothetical protein